MCVCVCSLCADFVRTGQSQLTFTSDGTQNILVGIIDDDISEQTEAFSISLVNPQPVGSVLAFPDRITITIIDDDDEISKIYIYITVCEC